MNGQQAEIEAYGAPLEARAATGSAGEPKTKVRSRRDLLRMAGVAVAGAAGAAALRAVPAAAANGDIVTVGGTFTGSARTNITNTRGTGFAGIGSSNAEGLDGISSGPLGTGVYGQSDNGIGVLGQATGQVAGQGVGVFGNSLNTSGIGVEGSASQAGGLGAYLIGGRAPLHLVTASLSGPPMSGAHAIGDIWMDNLGIPWICITDGTPGVFAPLQTGGAGISIFAKVSTQQYKLKDSDGATWVDMDATNHLQIITPAFSCQAVISANCDLWTVNAGYNQDIGIFISGGIYGSGQIVAWKESGGFAGTFSPNAAFVETTQPFVKAVAYTVSVRWKTNKPATGATIVAGAGTGPYSPTRLSTHLIVDVPVPMQLTVAGHDPRAGNDPTKVPPLLPGAADQAALIVSRSISPPRSVGQFT